MFNKNITLQGGKTTIRPFCQEDLDGPYMSWLNDANTMQYSSQRFLVHDVASSLRYLKSFEDTPNGFFAIEDSETRVLIGTMTVYCTPRDGVVDVGILIGDKSLAGQGFGKDCWLTMIEWLSSQDTIRKISAGTVATNKPMLGLMRAAGMIDDGCRRDQQLVEGKPVDIMYFAIFPHV